MPTPNQIVLAWDIDTSGTVLSPAQAATALGAVPLYQDMITDPVLGQLFGLTVASDSSAATGATTATRTLTLNMTAANAPAAPPPFPCRPITSTPPVLPYPLRKTVALAGSFFVSNGLATVPTTKTQLPSLVANDVVQFLSQEGVFYTVLSVTSTLVTLTAPYTGTTGNTEALKEVAAPVILAAVYSTSPLDTDGDSSVTPPIPKGPGAREVVLVFKDSTGSSFSTEINLAGKRPVVVALNGGIDIAEITSFGVEDATADAVGAFGNSVGQITLVEFSAPPPGLPANPTRLDLQKATDAGQLLISRALVYLPPSYFALAGQGSSAPQLAGDFLVTTGSKSVPTTVDQTAVLSQGDTIQFASQLQTYTPFGAVDVIYTVAAVTPKLVTLTSPYTGVDDNFTGRNNVGTNTNAGTKGNLGTEVINKVTAAQKVDPGNAAPPSNAVLAAPLGQFVDPGNAAPPPNPPLDPATMTPPVTVGGAVPFLSDLFTQTLQLALAGVPITPQPITFA